MGIIIFIISVISFFIISRYIIINRPVSDEDFETMHRRTTNYMILENHIRIAFESINIIEKTKNLSTFKSRKRVLLENLEAIQELSDHPNFNNAIENIKTKFEDNNNFYIVERIGSELANKALNRLLRNKVHSIFIDKYEENVRIIKNMERKASIKKRLADIEDFGSEVKAELELYKAYDFMNNIDFHIEDIKQKFQYKFE